MGFSRLQAEQAIQQHGSVQQALDSLLAGVGTLLWRCESLDERHFYVKTVGCEIFQASCLFCA